jgi:NAD(P)-dependent dehydrogenase (short-subunit alcohol dehydrogenase family)
MNKVWLVTGSASGLGRNIAEAVLESGDRLVATARDTKRLDDLVKKYGDRVRAVPLDVTDESAAQAAFARGYRLQQPSAQRHRGLTADGLAIRADGSSQVSGIGKIGPWPRSADNGREQMLRQGAACRLSAGNLEQCSLRETREATKLQFGR